MRAALIRVEALNRSQILNTLKYIIDVHCSRLYYDFFVSFVSDMGSVKINGVMGFSTSAPGSLQLILIILSVRCELMEARLNLFSAFLNLLLVATFLPAIMDLSGEE